MFKQPLRFGVLAHPQSVVRTWALLTATGALASCGSSDSGETSSSATTPDTSSETPSPGTSSSPSGVNPTPVASVTGGTTGSESPNNSTGTDSASNPTDTGVIPQPTGSMTTTGSSEPEPTSAPPVQEGDCEMPSSLVTFLSTKSIAEMGVPFDVDREDTIGPADWNSNYGKTPEVIVHSGGDTFDVLWRDTSKESQAFVVNVVRDGAEGYAVHQAYRVETLGQLMGFTRDDEGNYYFASGVDEDSRITVEDPPEGVYRPNIVRLVKFDPGGCVLWEVDVDTARGDAGRDPEPIVNPMVAGTSRLLWGGGQLALLHSINTAPDDNGVRHQKALTTHFSAGDGAVVRTEGQWVSHSFDQRLLWNGEGFVDLHLGDAYPRSLVMSFWNSERKTEGYDVYLPKGAEGDNATYTQLGSIVQVPTGDYGYWVFFATDRSPELATGQWQSLVGTRDVALVRVKRDFAESRPREGGFLEETGETHEVTWKGQAVSNPVRWITDLGTGGTELHAGRVRAVATAEDRVVALWEQWEPGQRRETFVGTFAIELDGDVETVTAAKRISDRHIPRGDDAFTLRGNAALVLGNQDGSLSLSLIEPGLETRTIVLP
jgi:hypothetical protein